MKKTLKNLTKKYRDQAKKRDNWNKVLKREIGQDFSSVTILIFFIFGIVCISVAYIYSLISVNEFITAFILWFTAVVVLDYTKETHDLKENSVRQIHESRKQYDYEMSPYLRLQWVGSSASIFQIVNDGKGIAVNVEFEPFSFIDDKEKSTFKIKSRPLIVGGHGYSDIGREEIIEGYKGLLGKDSSFYGYLGSKIDLGFFIQVKYKDFEGHSYIAVFKSNPNYNDKFEIVEQKRI